MANHLSDLLNEFGVKGSGSFQPHARYNHALDALVYLTEDATRVADRVDSWLTLYRHAHRDVIIGVKFKGFRYEFLRLKEQMGFSEGSFLPLVGYLERIFEEGVGDELIEASERQRKYEVARQCIRQVLLTPEDIRELVNA